MVMLRTSSDVHCGPAKGNAARSTTSSANRPQPRPTAETNRLNSGGPDERRCSDDKSSRWDCGHYTGQRKAHLFRRGDGRRDANVRVVVVTGGAPGYFI